jgi:MFS family permease
VNTLPVALLRKVSWRLLPFLLLMYIMAFLDRANVGFAKQAFQADTGISNAAFAFGAGVFFAGYALLEVPSNLIMHRVGARLWMCRIMVTWGLVSAAMVFAHDETTFYVLRFLLGVAEAGFFPGVILYLTYWFPSAARGKAMGFFYFGAPLAFIFGSPLSGLLLEMDGIMGTHGWQWLFAVEGLMASAVGIWAYFYLDNRPADATWLSAQERAQLQAVLDEEDSQKQSHGSLLKVLLQPAVLYLCAIYLLIQASVYGVVFYLPSQVAGLMGTKVGLMVGLVSAVPWLCALLAAWKVPGDLGPGHCRFGQFQQPAAGYSRAVLCRFRLHCCAAGVLDLSGKLPCRLGRCWRHCPDQFLRRARRFHCTHPEKLGRRRFSVAGSRVVPAGDHYLHRRRPGDGHSPATASRAAEATDLSTLNPRDRAWLFRPSNTCAPMSCVAAAPTTTTRATVTGSTIISPRP